MRLALKIDVDTFRGTREGVPKLVQLLKYHQAGATFLFSLGPDNTGRAIKRAFRPGFLKKVSRTSVIEHYGFRTLMYGTLLPGPDIGRKCTDILRSVQQAGFEVGIHTWDHINWQDNVTRKDFVWTELQMQKAATRFKEIFGVDAKTHGAAGWQMNPYAFKIEQNLQLIYASDGRGTSPFWPRISGETIPVLQIPTTLPTLDELIGLDGWNTENVHEHLLSLTKHHNQFGHVFTLHAELEGMKLIPTLDKLLAGWKAQGYELVSVLDFFNSLDKSTLPSCPFTMGKMPGRSGILFVQPN
jgi:peptidoglycan/xylan/chitin deacetylase (PgdA/CDA1 family)